MLVTLKMGESLTRVADIVRAGAFFCSRASGGESRQAAPEPRLDRPCGLEPGSSPDFAQAVTALFRLFKERGVSCLLVGGVALLKYIEGRNTGDIDFLMSADSLSRLPEIEITGRKDDFAFGRFRGLEVDILLTSNRVFALAAERFAATHRFAEMEVACATVEGLILLRLYALPFLYSQRDFARVSLYEADLRMLMQRHRPDVPPLVDLLAPHLSPAQVRELRGIVREIQEQIQRSEQRAGG